MNVVMLQLSAKDSRTVAEEYYMHVIEYSLTPFKSYGVKKHPYRQFLKAGHLVSCPAFECVC